MSEPGASTSEPGPEEPKAVSITEPPQDAPGSRAQTESGQTVLEIPAARDTRTRPSPSPRVSAVDTASGTAMPETTSMPSTASISGGSTRIPPTVASSPVEALAHAEVLRTRNFVRVGLAVTGGATVLVLPGREPGIVIAFLCAVATAAAGMIYMIVRTRSPATFHHGNGVARAWYVIAVAAGSVIPYFGPYSPAPALLVLGIYVIGMGASFRLAFAIYLTLAIIQAITGVLPILGVADPGYIQGAYLERSVQILAQVMTQILLFASFSIARATRRSSLVALGELQRAVRAVAQREALLEEAREELHRAIGIGTGRGRFTDQTIGVYQLGELIGQGAMGEVYEGVDPTTGGGAVAVKMLAHASLSNPHHVQRFMRELQTAATIDSPNVVRVLAVGEHPLPHLVMERLHGRDLSTILRDPRPMTHDQVVDLIRQIGAGITAAAAAGVIHRDLKPQNLFLAGTVWKILDFGVSRVANSGDTLTAGHVVGTPAYMAPEQARGGSIDHRADLYALAAIAYRALTGAAPFGGGELADLLYRVVHTAPRRPSQIVSLPEDVDLVLAIGLAKSPEDRLPTAAELVDGLTAALADALSQDLRARGRSLVARGAWAAAPRRLAR